MLPQLEIPKTHSTDRCQTASIPAAGLRTDNRAWTGGCGSTFFCSRNRSGILYQDEEGRRINLQVQRMVRTGEIGPVRRTITTFPGTDRPHVNFNKRRSNITDGFTLLRKLCKRRAYHRIMKGRRRHRQSTNGGFGLCLTVARGGQHNQSLSELMLSAGCDAWQERNASQQLGVQPQEKTDTSPFCLG